MGQHRDGDSYEECSDNEVSTVEHSKLLAAISQLDGKQRVKPPSRKEPSLQVSEFHLVQSGAKEDDVDLQDLAKVLESRASHAAIRRKLQAVRNKTKTLPKPLEKPVAEKIKRSEGFEQVKKQLSRWDAVVYKNRVADQLFFPLNHNSIRVVEGTEEFLSKFQSKSPLEAQIDEILKSNEAAKEENEEKEEDFSLSLEELMERRKEMAHLRARQSFRESKARRQGKIKSKKYHRIQRRERTRQQLKEFEALQKTDPEAALKQLELLERSRAEERMTLRHRSTGQWAKNKAVRAKYDQQSRQALAEQLSISRDLTQKVQLKGSSDDEEEEEEEVQLNGNSNISVDENNPWLSNKSPNEVETFVTGYRKYWEKRHKTEAAGKLEKSIDNSEATKSNDKCSAEDRIGNETLEESNDENEAKAKDMYGSNSSFEEGDPLDKRITLSKEKKKTRSQSEEKSVKKICVTQERQHNVSGSKLTVSSGTKKKCSVESTLKGKTDNVKQKKSECTLGEVSSKQPDEIESITGNLNPNKVIGTSSGWIVTPSSSPNNINKRDKSNNSWNVSLNDSKKVKAKTKKVNNAIGIDDAFNKMEETMKKAVIKKLAKWKHDVNIHENNIPDTPEHHVEKEPSLEIKKSIQRPREDTELLESSGQVNNNIGSDEHSLGQLEHLASTKSSRGDAVSKTGLQDVDPNKFMRVKPRRLNTQLPDDVTAGDEALDDEAEEAHRLAISEAFADDDVLADFNKEKEDAVEKTKLPDVDLTLPGWGSWGGKNLSLPKRKKRRFILKFPEAAPRKDQNKGNLIINEDKDTKVKQHQVNELPFPFTSVKDFEASIRAPISNTFVPETAYRRLIRPHIVTKLGTVIEPMDEEVLVKKKKLSFI